MFMFILQFLSSVMILSVNVKYINNNDMNPPPIKLTKATLNYPDTRN